MSIANDPVTLGTASVPVVPAKKPIASPALYRFVGTAVSALICALFWSAMVAFFAPMLGYTVSASGLLITGMTVGAFVWAVMTAILSQAA